SGEVRAAGHPAIGAAIHTAATNAFLHGLSIGCLVACGVAIAGALLALRFLPSQPPSAPEPLVAPDRGVSSVLSGTR
ncbi:MAG: hypothetical protein ACRD1G_08125, partial [Acidimicrobiales bacterium]